MRRSLYLLVGFVLAGCSAASGSSLSVVSGQSETSEAPAAVAAEDPVDVATAVPEEVEAPFVNVEPAVLPELMIEYQVMAVADEAGPPTFRAVVRRDPVTDSDTVAGVDLVMRDAGGAETLRLPIAQSDSDAGVGLAWAPAVTDATSFVVDRPDGASSPTVSQSFSLTVSATSRLVTIKQSFRDEAVLPEDGDLLANAPVLVGSIAVSSGGEWTNLSIADTEATRRWPVDRLVFSAEGVGVEGPSLWFAFSTTNGFEIKTEVVGPFTTS